MNLPISLVVLHFVADFILQSDWMAVNKSRRWDALALHVAVYSIVFLVFVGWQFAAVTFVAHFVTDAITSRITRRLFFFRPATGPRYDGATLWERAGGSQHWFFVVIGIDQVLHYLQLALTWAWLS